MSHDARGVDRAGASSQAVSVAVAEVRDLVAAPAPGQQAGERASVVKLRSAANRGREALGSLSLAP